MFKGMLGMLPLSAVRGPIDTLWQNLAGKDGLAVLTELKKFNRREPCWTVAAQSPRTIEELPPLLVFDDTHVASVSQSKPHDPATFWRDTDESPARRVWKTFQRVVVARARPTKPMGIVKTPYAGTSHSTTVREILAVPGVGDHDPSELSRLIAAMIAAQPNGELLKDGLLNGGRGNLFPCGSVLVDVHRYDDYGTWDAFALGPDSVVNAGVRVFSGNLKL